MRTAALFDIHGNLPALEAVLDDARQSGVEQIVIGGDVVPGPFPRETVKRLLALDIPTRFLYGNCEIAVLEQMAGRHPSAVPEQQWPVIRWAAQQLFEYQSLFAAWPKTLSIEMPDWGNVLFCHATPRDENEIFTRLTSEERLLPVFQGIDARVVVCGHTHMQFDRMVGSTRVVNAGSVGMPFGKPGADWLLLGPGIELRHTSYDLEKAADRIRESDDPEAANFIARFLFNPPTESEMLELFARAELKAGS
jgi:predicted phosphodiesterase